jgi:hypothetical protein
MNPAGNTPDRDEHLLSDRKHRLLACGLCRQIAPLIHQPELLSVLEASEAFADGLVTAVELCRAQSRACEIARSNAKNPALTKYASAVARVAAVAHPSSLTLYKTVDPATVAVIREFRGIVLKLLVDDGITFRWVPGYAEVSNEIGPHPVTCCPAWRIDTALSLARQMYESRDFSAMPILADALQDAGCDNEDILTHCRWQEFHVRGCWVLDLVLGLG